MGTAHTGRQRPGLTSIVTAAGIVALVLAPAVAQADTDVAGEAAPDAASENTLGPDGYKSLELGMSEDEAIATGLLTDRQELGDCTWFYLDPAEGEQNPGAGVVVSPTHGVVSIPGTQSNQTPEGVTMGSVHNDEGSTTEQIEGSYDKYTVDKTGPTPIYTAPAPGNPDAHYIFAIGDDDRAKDMGLTADDDGGCGLNA